MQRIYLPNTQFSQDILLDAPELHHQITRVLRARVGQEIIFFDGEELIDYLYEIRAISKSSIQFFLREKRVKSSENSLHLHLYQALPNKLDKLEYIIQKCSEVGYSSIYIFPSERSQKLVLSENKIARLQKIAIEACEQCGGNIIPNLQFLDSLHIPQKNVFYLHTSETQSIQIGKLGLSAGQDISLIIGPEGGFSPQEIGEFQKQGLEGIYLGKRIFRTESTGAMAGFYLTQKLQD